MPSPSVEFGFVDKELIAIAAASRELAASLHKKEALLRNDFSRSNSQLITFFRGINFTELEEDASTIRDMQEICHRNGSDSKAETLNRIADTLEEMLEIAEQCGIYTE